MKDVVYLSCVTLTEKVERDWYISYLHANRVKVEYWDVTEILFSGVKFQEPLDRDYLVNVHSYEQLEGLLAEKELVRTNFVILISYARHSTQLYRLLTRYCCKLYYIEWGNFPVQDRRNLADRCRWVLQNPRKFASTLFDRLIFNYGKRFKLVKQFDVVFFAGTVSMSNHPFAAKHIAVNLCDYDNYLLAQEKQNIFPVTKYAVFLDINLAFHTDIEALGWDYLDPTLYGNSLNNFFQMIEDFLHVKVVIAAHPNANYNPNYFMGRTVMQGQTPELVKDAEIVISHDSTSISYAVLNKKPLLFIYTSNMEQIYRKTTVQAICDIAEYLGQPVYNIDKVTSAEEISLTCPDSVRYDLYKYNYLTSKESEKRLNREIMLAELTE